MFEDKDANPETEAEDAQETQEADYRPADKGKPGRPAAPRSTFRKVKTREYAAGTSRTLANGLVVTDS